MEPKKDRTSPGYDVCAVSSRVSLPVLNLSIKTCTTYEQRIHSRYIFELSSTSRANPLET
jgi:hypothetical protein